MLCWRGWRPWHPSVWTVSVTPVAVFAACCFSSTGLCNSRVHSSSSSSLFCTCYGSPPNSGIPRLSTPPPQPLPCTSSFSDYLGFNWQSIVFCTDLLFVYRAPKLNLWTTLNHNCLSSEATGCTSWFMLFFLFSPLHRSRESLSRAGICRCVYPLFIFTAVFPVIFVPDTTPRQTSPVWLTLQRTFAWNSRARCKAR